MNFPIISAAFIMSLPISTMRPEVHVLSAYETFRQTKKFTFAKDVKAEVVITTCKCDANEAREEHSATHTAFECQSQNSLLCYSKEQPIEGLRGCKNGKGHALSLFRIIPDTIYQLKSLRKVDGNISLDINGNRKVNVPSDARFLIINDSRSNSTFTVRIRKKIEYESYIYASPLEDTGQLFRISQKFNGPNETDLLKGGWYQMDISEARILPLVNKLRNATRLGSKICNDTSNFTMNVSNVETALRKPLEINYFETLGPTLREVLTGDKELVFSYSPAEIEISIFDKCENRCFEFEALVTKVGDLLVVSSENTVALEGTFENEPVFFPSRRNSFRSSGKFDSGLMCLHPINEAHRKTCKNIKSGEFFETTSNVNRSANNYDATDLSADVSNESVQKNDSGKMEISGKFSNNSSNLNHVHNSTKGTADDVQKSHVIVGLSIAVVFLVGVICCLIGNRSLKGTIIPRLVQLWRRMPFVDEDSSENIPIHLERPLIEHERVSSV